METLTDWIILWWLLIAVYQLGDYLADELIYNESKFQALYNIFSALVVIPVLPVVKVFSALVSNMIKVKVNETIEQED